MTLPSYNSLTHLPKDDDLSMYDTQYKLDLTEWADDKTPKREPRVYVGHCDRHGKVIITQRKTHSLGMECPRPKCCQCLIWKQFSYVEAKAKGWKID